MTSMYKPGALAAALENIIVSDGERRVDNIMAECGDTFSFIIGVCRYTYYLVEPEFMCLERVSSLFWRWWRWQW